MNRIKQIGILAKADYTLERIKCHDLIVLAKDIEVDGIRPGATMASHGCDLVGAEMMAREMDVQVLVFGHIHRPLNREGPGVCSSVRAAPRFFACRSLVWPSWR